MDGFELLGGMEIVLTTDSFSVFLHQQMGSASLSHYIVMAWGCWYCDLKGMTRGNAGYGGSLLVQHCPCIYLRLVWLLPQHCGPSQNHHRLVMVGLMWFGVVQLCHQQLCVQGGSICWLILFLSIWCWTVRQSSQQWMQASELTMGGWAYLGILSLFLFHR